MRVTTSPPTRPGPRPKTGTGTGTSQQQLDQIAPHRLQAQLWLRMISLEHVNVGSRISQRQTRGPRTSRAQSLIDRPKRSCPWPGSSLRIFMVHPTGAFSRSRGRMP
jgi:hypothetical protein